MLFLPTIGGRLRRWSECRTFLLKKGGSKANTFCPLDKNGKDLRVLSNPLSLPPSLVLPLDLPLETQAGKWIGSYVTHILLPACSASCLLLFVQTATELVLSVIYSSSWFLCAPINPRYIPVPNKTSIYLMIFKFVLFFSQRLPTCFWKSSQSSQKMMRSM